MLEFLNDFSLRHLSPSRRQMAVVTPGKHCTQPGLDLPSIYMIWLNHLQDLYCHTERRGSHSQTAVWSQTGNYFLNFVYFCSVRQGRTEIFLDYNQFVVGTNMPSCSAWIQFADLTFKGSGAQVTFGSQLCQWKDQKSCVSVLEHTSQGYQVWPLSFGLLGNWMQEATTARVE